MRDQAVIPSVETLGSMAQDYVKAIWSATEWGGAPATAKALVARFGTTPAAVSDAIKRLTAQGLIEHEPYRAIALTANGERLALQMVRRHRLIETFLVTTLGYDWAEVHREADRLEHAASDLLIDRIDALLGHPERDPHGDPIPTSDGIVRRPSDAIRLTDATPGEYRVVRVSDTDSGLLQYFAERGLLPEARIAVTVLDGHAHTVVVRAPHDARLALAAPASDSVIVAPDPG